MRQPRASWLWTLGCWAGFLTHLDLLYFSREPETVRCEVGPCGLHSCQLARIWGAMPNTEVVSMYWAASLGSPRPASLRSPRIPLVCTHRGQGHNEPATLLWRAEEGVSIRSGPGVSLGGGVVGLSKVREGHRATWIKCFRC